MKESCCCLQGLLSGTSIKAETFVSGTPACNIHAAFASVNKSLFLRKSYCIIKCCASDRGTFKCFQIIDFIVPIVILVYAVFAITPLIFVFLFFLYFAESSILGKTKRLAYSVIGR